MAWSDVDKAAAVKSFFEDGEVASKIAKRFGVTRSAVLGLMHRHRVKNRISTRSPVAPMAKKSPRRPTVTIHKPAIAGMTAMTGTKISPWPKAPGGLSIAEIGTAECRFAITSHDVGKSEHRFCGAPADGSFCAHHTRLVYLTKPE